MEKGFPREKQNGANVSKATKTETLDTLLTRKNIIMTHYFTPSKFLTQCRLSDSTSKSPRVFRTLLSILSGLKMQRSK